jgi:hypothetical protein
MIILECSLNYFSNLMLDEQLVGFMLLSRQIIYYYYYALFQVTYVGKDL